MIEKLKGCLRDANNTSLLIVKYGVMLSCAVLTFAAIQLERCSFVDLNKFQVSFEIIKIGLIIFAESFIAGIVVDLYLRKIEKNKG